MPKRYERLPYVCRFCGRMVKWVGSGGWWRWAHEDGTKRCTEPAQRDGSQEGCTDG